MARRDWIIACGIFAIALIVRVGLLGSPVHDYDEGVYWQSLLAMQDGYAQYRDIFVSQPPLFLDATYLFFVTLGNGIVAARVPALLGSLLTIASGSWIAYRISGRVGAIFAVAFLTLNAFDLEQSVTLEAEALATGLATLSVALVVERSRGTINGPLFAAAAGAVAAAAILVKFLAVACIVPFLAFVLWNRDIRGLLAYSIGAVGFTIAAMIPHFSALHPMLAQTVSFHLSSHVVLRSTRFSTMGSGFHVPLVLLTLTGAVIAVRRKDRTAIAIVAWLAAVCVLFLKITPLFPHHLAAAQAPLVVLAAYGLSQIVNVAPVWMNAAIVVAVIGVEGWYAGAAVQTIFHPPFPSRISTALFERNLPRGKWVITDLQGTAALAGYRTPPDLVDTSLVRILSGNLTSEELIRNARDPRVDAIVFGGRRFALPQVRAFYKWAHANYHRTSSPFILTR